MTPTQKRYCAIRHFNTADGNRRSEDGGRQRVCFRPQSLAPSKNARHALLGPTPTLSPPGHFLALLGASTLRLGPFFRHGCLRLLAALFAGNLPHTLKCPKKHPEFWTFFGQFHLLVTCSLTRTYAHARKLLLNNIIVLSNPGDLRAHARGRLTLWPQLRPRIPAPVRQPPLRGNSRR